MATHTNLIPLGAFLAYCRSARLDPVELLLSAVRICIRQHKEIGNMQAMPDAVIFLRVLLRLSSKTHPRYAIAVEHLGLVLCTKYIETQDRKDLEEGIRCQMQAENIRSPGFETKNMEGYAKALYARYESYGSTDYLELALQLQREIVACYTPADPHYGAVLDSLGAYLYVRFDRLGILEDLDDAIVKFRESLDLPESRHASTRATRSSNLANGLQVRYKKFGSPEDLAEAIQLHREGVSLRSDTDKQRPHSYHNLANALMSHFSRTGSSDVLDESIQLYQDAVDLLRSSDDKGLPDPYGSLAAALEARYHLHGDQRDLEEAIRLSRESLELFDPRNPDRSAALNNLASVLETRYRYTQKLEELEEGIVHLREAVRLRQPGHPYRSDSLGNLANLLATRFASTGRFPDWIESVRLHRESLELRPEGHPTRSNALNSLAHVLDLCSHPLLRQDMDTSATDEAIGLHHEALKLREPGHPLRWHTFNNLSSAHLNRFRLCKDPKDAVKSLAMMEETLACMAPGHSNRAKCLFSKAGLYLEPDVPFHSVAVALPFLFEAISDNHWNAQLRLSSTIGELDKIEQLDDVLDTDTQAEVLRLYVLAVRLLPRVAYFGLDVESRLQALKQSEHIAMKGASLAIALSRPEVAVELLEEGRAAFWTQALRLRTQFDELPEHLRDGLTGLSRQLESGSYGATQSSRGQASKVDIEAEAACRRQQSTEFDALLEEARSSPGFEQFMLQDTFNTLAHVADNGPVVILLAGKTSCHAILIQSPGSASTVDLPLMNVHKLEALGTTMTESNGKSRELMSDDRALVKIMPHGNTEDVLLELWEKVVKIVLDALHFKPSDGYNRPRLWWCPTGPFTFLPIHAAGRYKEGGDCLSNYVVSSYTPTLRALLNARKKFSPVIRTETKMLLAAVPRAYRGNPLPYTVEEVKAVKAVVPAEFMLSLSREEDASFGAMGGATVQTMMAKLPETTLLHLASHGYQNPRNPLESGFLMRDGILSISKLMPLPLPRAFLAFLSACETAKGDSSQPDQTVHLAATLLFAGFKSVIGTMWSMYDCDGPLVATTVYQKMLAGNSEHLDPEIAPYALDAAMQILRAAGHPASRWATYIHIGI